MGVIFHATLLKSELTRLQSHVRGSGVPLPAAFPRMGPELPSPHATEQDNNLLPNWSISVHHSLQLVSGEGLEDDGVENGLRQHAALMGLFPPPLQGCCELGGHHVMGDRLYQPSTLDSGFPAHPPLCAQAHGPAPSLRGAVAPLKMTGSARNVGPRV